MNRFWFLVVAMTLAMGSAAEARCAGPLCPPGMGGHPPPPGGGPPPPPPGGEPPPPPWMGHPHHPHGGHVVLRLPLAYPPLQPAYPVQPPAPPVLPPVYVAPPSLGPAYDYYDLSDPAVARYTPEPHRVRAGSCVAVKSELRHFGYRKVRTLDCRGAVYRFSARRGLAPVVITVERRSGRMSVTLR